MVSLVTYYPVFYTLVKNHSQRGFDIIIIIASLFTYVIYKIAFIFGLSNLFIPQDSWAKLANIMLLSHLLSLMIYLSRI